MHRTYANIKGFLSSEFYPSSNCDNDDNGNRFYYRDRVEPKSFKTKIKCYIHYIKNFRKKFYWYYEKYFDQGTGMGISGCLDGSGFGCGEDPNNIFRIGIRSFSVKQFFSFEDQSES